MVEQILPDKLPPLKPTIQVQKAGVDFWQQQTWILFDQVKNKFYYLGATEYIIIKHWHLADPHIIKKTLYERYKLTISDRTFSKIINFLLL